MAAAGKNELRRYGVTDDRRTPVAQRVVWFGTHRIAVADIVAVEPSQAFDRPVSGLFVAASSFIAIAAVFAFLVFDNGWRDRYLIATALFAVLGAAGFRETIHAKAQRFFEVRIATRTNGQVAFASVDDRETRDFLEMLQQEGVPVRRAR